MTELMDYISNNATWLGIVGVALLVVLVLVGIILYSRRSAKHNQALDAIGERLEEMRQEGTSAEQEETETEKVPTYDEAMEAFFAETEVTALEEAQTSEAMEAEKAESATQETSELATQETLEPTTQEIPATGDFVVDEKLPETLKIEAEAAMTSLYDTGRSGRRYSREEIENQIKQ